VRDEKRLHVTEMRMLKCMCVVTRMDRIKNKYIRGSLKVASVTKKMRSMVGTPVDVDLGKDGCTLLRMT
jgi:hypothetical protein